MKGIFFLLFLLITNLFSNDFDLEIMSASDGSNATIFKFSDNINGYLDGFFISILKKEKNN